ncbi:MAG: MarR family transcriptional regulator [Epsilonproteobacteria bacterium]|nr:MarR family transcriptional regulator [Campylobacterota bacterium]
MKTWIQLLRAQHKISAKETLYIQSQGLTMGQFKVLEVLYHRGNLHIGTITSLTMSTPGNMTVIVKNLKKQEFITSIKDPKDKRASLLSITHKGKNIINNLFGEHANNLKTYFEILDENELETLFTLLRKLQKAQ